MTPLPQPPLHWGTMSTYTLLEQASALSKGLDDRDDTTRCIDALIWRLKADEEWIVSQRRRGPSGNLGLDEALRSYGMRLAKTCRQHPGSKGGDEACELAVSCFNDLLEVLAKAALLPPDTRGQLSDWFWDKVE
jgi:hypothetical protein